MIDTRIQGPRRSARQYDPSEWVEAREYEAPNWFTARGVNKKRQIIENKGLPSFFRWRFITLTLDLGDYATDQEKLDAYLAGKKRLVPFVRRLKAHGMMGKNHAGAGNWNSSKTGMRTGISSLSTNANTPSASCQTSQSSGHSAELTAKWFATLDSFTRSNMRSSQCVLGTNQSPSISLNTTDTVNTKLNGSTGNAIERNTPKSLRPSRVFDSGRHLKVFIPVNLLNERKRRNQSLASSPTPPRWLSLIQCAVFRPLRLSPTASSWEATLNRRSSILISALVNSLCEQRNIRLSVTRRT